MKRDTTKVVEAIDRLHLRGNIINPHWLAWLSAHLGGKSSIYVPIAALILSDILYWYRAQEIRDEDTGHVIQRQKRFQGDKLQRSYKAIAEQWSITKRQAKEAVKLLVETEAITIEFRTITRGETRLNNVLYLEPVPETLQKWNTPVSIPRETLSPPAAQNQKNGETLEPGELDPLPTRGTGSAAGGETNTKISTKTSTEISTEITLSPDCASEPNEREPSATLFSDPEQPVLGQPCQARLDISPWNDPLGLAPTPANPDDTQSEPPSPNDRPAPLSGEKRPQPPSRSPNRTPSSAARANASHSDHSEFGAITGGSRARPAALRSKLGALGFHVLNRSEHAGLREALIVLDGQRVVFSEVAIAGATSVWPEKKTPAKAMAWLSQLCRRGDVFKLEEIVEAGQRSPSSERAQSKANYVASLASSNADREEVDSQARELMLPSVIEPIARRLKSELDPAVVTTLQAHPGWEGAMQKFRIIDLHGDELDAISAALATLKAARSQ